MTRITIICTLLALVLGTASASARTRTTRANLQVNNLPVEVLTIEDTDSAALADVDPETISLRGFNKRKSDTKESFLITNHSSHRISSVRLFFRYTTLTGQLIHERTVSVPVSLKPGETQMASVRTFDVQRLFYYYAGPKPRKEATPFKVAYRLVGYDIPVGK